MLSRLSAALCRYHHLATASLGLRNDSQDKGRWWVKGNQFCNKFNKIRSGKEACQDIVKTGDNQYRFGNSATATPD
jgi:hypothetical protein